MKILHIITGLNTGGAEIMLYRLLAYQDKSQFQSVVISLDNQGTLGKPISNLNIPVYCLNLKNNKLSITSIYKLWKIIRSIKPDIVHGCMYHGNLFAVFLKPFIGWKVPIIWTIHSSLYSLNHEKLSTAIVIWLGKIFDFYAKKIIYVSTVSKQQHEKIGFDQTKSIVIPNGFDVTQFRPSQEFYSGLREELNLDKSCLLIGLIARYHPQKDHENFLNASAYLLKKNVKDKIAFLLCGTNVDKNNLHLKKIISQLNITQQVYLLGERRDIPRITAALDIATLSSAYGEALPNVIGEAMACSKPCVVTDIGDSRWFVGKTGKVVPPCDPEALAQAWKELIDMGETRKKLGQKARKRIVDKFSIGIAVSKYEDVYHQVFLKNNI